MTNSFSGGAAFDAALSVSAGGQSSDKSSNISNQPYLQAIEELKTQASILLKSFKTGKPQKSELVASRFQVLPEYADQSVNQLMQLSEKTKLKQALQVIATENQFDSWQQLKQQLEVKQAHVNSIRLPKSSEVLPTRCMGFTNVWYNLYDEAKHHQKTTGGYIFPFRSQYFIASDLYVETLGIPAEDARWQKIGFDWCRPADKTAWRQLNAEVCVLALDLKVA